MTNHCFLDMRLIWLCADVLALAEGLDELTFHTREARTALWCALQLSSTDLPLVCIRAAETSARRVRFLATGPASDHLVPDEDADEMSDCEADVVGKSNNAKPDRSSSSN